MAIVHVYSHSKFAWFIELMPSLIMTSQFEPVEWTIERTIEEWKGNESRENPNLLTFLLLIIARWYLPDRLTSCPTASRETRDMIHGSRKEVTFVTDIYCPFVPTMTLLKICSRWVNNIERQKKVVIGTFYEPSVVSEVIELALRGDLGRYRIVAFLINMRIYLCNCDKLLKNNL